MKGLPNIWCQLLNMNCKPCPICNKKGIITSIYHLKEDHKMNIRSPMEIWNELTPVATSGDKRHAIKSKTTPIIEAHLNVYKSLLST